jgi:hypothetical protein
MEATSCGVYQVIESTKLGKVSFDGLFVRELNGCLVAFPPNGATAF